MFLPQNCFLLPAHEIMAALNPIFESIRQKELQEPVQTGWCLRYLQNYQRVTLSEHGCVTYHFNRVVPMVN